MTVAYDGTHYAGWQVQPSRLTIQGMLEKAIAQVCHERTRVTGSGRTDSGVHAIGQVASFSLDTWRADPAALMRALNSKLPADICVRGMVETRNDFHAIRDASGKRYRYQIQVGGARNAFEHRYHWHIPGPVDLAAMRQAAESLCGRNDFASFQAAGSDRKTTIRNVLDLAVLKSPVRSLSHTPDSERPDTALPPTQSNRSAGQGGEAHDSTQIAIEIEADGFLYNMVRNIVGTLVQIGLRKRPVQWATEVLQAKDRKAAGPTAPPHGLFLLWVKYTEESPLHTDSE